MKLRSKWKKALRITAMILASISILLTAVYIILIAHKKEILSAVTAAINQHINGKVELRDIRFTLFDEFPSITIEVKDLLVTDSLVGTRPDTILKAGELSLIFPLGSLFSKQKVIKSFALKDAKISLLKSANGKTNLNLIRYRNADETTTGRSAPEPRKIHFKNVSFSFADSAKQKFFSFNFNSCIMRIKYGDSTMEYKMKSIIHFDHLTFNSEKGGYLTNTTLDLNVEGQIFPGEKTISISGGTVKTNNQLLAIQSKFSLGKNPSLLLNLFSKSMKPQVAYSLLTKNIEDKLSPYQVYKPVTVYTTISTSLAPGSDPKVNIYIKSNGNRISFANRSIDNLTFLGRFTNHLDATKPSDDPNSQLAFPVFDGEIFQIPMKAQVQIMNLKSPYLVMQARSDLDKNLTAKLVDEKRLKIISGDAHVRLSYSGPLVNYVDTVNKQVNASIAGSIVLNDFALDYLPREFEFRKINGTLVFDSNDLHINTISLEMNRNSAYLNGDFRGLIPFLFTSFADTHGDLSLTAPTINLNNFNFEKDTTATAAIPEKKIKQKDAVRNPVADAIDRIMERFELNFILHADKVLYQHFTASNLESDITYSNDFVHFKNVSMKAAGGNFSFAGFITKLSKPRHDADLTASIQNADISSLMKGFDNFGQSIITEHDVDGKIKADISFHTQLGHGFKVIPSTMKGKMKVSIKDGELNNFESLKQISNYVFKDRDFSNIKFTGVENEYELNGSEVTFSHLDVYSSVLTFFAEGKYDFNKTNTLMLIYIPLGNLKKSKTEELAAHPDSNRKSGIGLTLKAEYGTDNKMHISPVVFGKKKIREDIQSNSPMKHEEAPSVSKQEKKNQK